MIGPLQVGKPNKHVNVSNGPDNKIMKFYITEYSSHFLGDRSTPQTTKHVGTGYKSNFRPGVYYSRKLDELDNPAVGKLIKDNYNTTTHLDYKLYKDSNGTSVLPADIYNAPSGFVTDRKRTLPTSNQIQSQYKDASQGLNDKKKPISNYKYPLFNGNSNVRKHTSENHSQFLPKCPHVDIKGKTIGDLEDTGFTKAKNWEPITFYPENNFDMENQQLYRPVGASVMKTSYQPCRSANAANILRKTGDVNVDDTGFTRYILPTSAHTSSKDGVYTKLEDLKNPSDIRKLKKSDPAEYLNATNPHPYVSIKQGAYQGQQLPKNISDEIQIGTKEDTGYTENNKKFLGTGFGIGGSTTYHNQYFDKNPYYPFHNKDVHEILPDGYTKSEKLHTLGERSHNLLMQATDLRPYVNRSLKARDPFYAEQMNEINKTLSRI